MKYMVIYNVPGYCEDFVRTFNSSDELIKFLKEYDLYDYANIFKVILKPVDLV